ncbi:MAG: selenocysteine-specific translation elongation factor [Bryobacteraceae bacterium]|nr:selenocysteine-specific translation elongation factor [Bryobacterales bacterium]MEB2364165.1 selenocysteine-specific translation elongation factor [Bryobacterales bacterium]NUN02975.1 selenocysteine-specific translation elongation factor [Bryobacteraceae bacterium]
MKNLTIGTAGHIDHGKTALVRALTGVDTDRLAEEKRRGISIDLGFAHMDLSSGLRIGFVDVPGHERFVKNMLAGVAGIDMVLFVIAADESIKPQTREHFDICRLLDVRKGILVLTKSDLAEPDILELVKLEAEDFVRGSFLEGAPTVAVSSTTGEGLDQLRAEIRQMAESIPSRNTAGLFRLPIDRSFSMKGFGAVVTGTLAAGSVKTEQEVEVQPSAQRFRVRGIQVHGEGVESAEAGQRTALNLAGADHRHLTRGMVLTVPGLLRPTTRLDCLLYLLPSSKPLKHGAPVHFHAGTAEVEGEIRMLDRLSALAPGESTFLRILLRHPVLLLPGDRFIVRMFSPVVTIGGGRVIDIDVPRRISRPEAFRRMQFLSKAGDAARVSTLVRESACGLSLAGLVVRTGLPLASLETLARRDEFVASGGWLLDRKWFSAASAGLSRVLEDFHRANPLLPGIPKQDLRSRRFPDCPPPLFDELVYFNRALVADGEFVRSATHRITLQENEAEALETMERLFRDAGLAVPATKDVLARSGLDAVRSRRLLQMLLRSGKLVRVGEDLVYHQTALEGLKSLLATHVGERFAVAEFKDWTGISRKYAIPLLEYLDREGVTRRQGDARVVLSAVPTRTA